MKKVLHIGIKKILATAMTRIEYNNYRGWELPEDEKHAADDPGFLVEYVSGLDDDSNHPDHGGYISWSPKDVFEDAYKQSGEMSFGMAIDAARCRYKISRTGWNGTGMYVYLVPANKYPAQTEAIEGVYDDDMVPYGEYWAIRKLDGEIVPWAPSGSDSLANDWVLHES